MMGNSLWRWPSVGFVLGLCHMMPQWVWQAQPSCSISPLKPKMLVWLFGLYIIVHNEVLRQWELVWSAHLGLALIRLPFFTHLLWFDADPMSRYLFSFLFMDTLYHLILPHPRIDFIPFIFPCGGQRTFTVPYRDWRDILASFILFAWLHSYYFWFRSVCCRGDCALPLLFILIMSHRTLSLSDMLRTIGSHMLAII